MDLLEDLFKRTHGQLTHLDKFHDNLFGDFEDKLIFLFHVFPLKNPRRLEEGLSLFSGGYGLRRTRESPPYEGNLSNYNPIINMLCAWPDPLLNIGIYIMESAPRIVFLITCKVSDARRNKPMVQGARQQGKNAFSDA